MMVGRQGNWDRKCLKYVGLGDGGDVRVMCSVLKQHSLFKYSHVVPSASSFDRIATRSWIEEE
jgi:hypothetical protein